MTFGEYFKELRNKKKLGLNEFAAKYGFSASTISKVERGAFTAPRSEEILKSYAKALGLRVGSEEWIKFHDLAHASTRTFEVKNIKDAKVLENLPAFIRLIDSEKFTSEDLNLLVRIAMQTSLGQPEFDL